MQNEDTIPGYQSDGLNVTPASPSITPKPGWTTSQGQMTATFALVCTILALVGFHYTPTQLEGWADSIEHISSIIGPLLAAMVTLVGYTFSRGHVYAASAAATAQMQTGGTSPLMAASLVSPGTVGKIATIGSEVLSQGGLGGTGWKDPARYQNLLHIASEAGVPGANTVDAVSQKVPAEDIITGILSMFHKKTKHITPPTT